MLFEKENKPHHMVYKIGNIKITFSKKFTSKTKFLKKLYNLKYRLYKTFLPERNLKKYKLIIPFGMSCAFSTRFFYYFKFDDSTFWNWVWAVDPDVQIKVFEHPELLFSGNKKFIPHGGGMWACDVTGMSFHSKRFYNDFLKSDGSLDKQMLEEDFEELMSRTKYLYEKTKKYMASKDKKLFAYNMLNLDCDVQTHIEKIKRLYDYIETKTENFDFLLITARQNFDKVQCEMSKTHPKIFVRKVKSYYSDGHQDLSRDRIGWIKIFKEFQPEIIQKSKIKTVKFNQIELNKLNE